MKYKLPIRRMVESDLSLDCRILPDHDEFEMYLSALVEDIGNLNVVIKVSFDFDTKKLIIEINSESDFPQLHSSVKSLLQNQYLCKLTTSSGFKIIE